MLYIDEFYTSQMCHECRVPLVSVPGRPRDKECTKKCGIINRDRHVHCSWCVWGVNVVERPGVCAA